MDYSLSLVRLCLANRKTYFMLNFFGRVCFEQLGGLEARPTSERRQRRDYDSRPQAACRQSEFQFVPLFENKYRELVNRHRHIIRRQRIPRRALQLSNRLVQVRLGAQFVAARRGQRRLALEQEEDR